MNQLDTESVWQDFRTSIYEFIRRRVNDDHVADDLLQTVFLKVHRSLATLKDSELISAWIHQVARNSISDHYRRNPDRR